MTLVYNWYPECLNCVRDTWFNILVILILFSWIFYAQMKDLKSRKIESLRFRVLKSTIDISFLKGYLSIVCLVVGYGIYISITSFFTTKPSEDFIEIQKRYKDVICISGKLSHFKEIKNSEGRFQRIEFLDESKGLMVPEFTFKKENPYCYEHTKFSLSMKGRVKMESKGDNIKICGLDYNPIKGQLNCITELYILEAEG